VPKVCLSASTVPYRFIHRLRRRCFWSSSNRFLRSLRPNNCGRCSLLSPLDDFAERNVDGGAVDILCTFE